MVALINDSIRNSRLKKIPDISIELFERHAAETAFPIQVCNSSASAWALAAERAAFGLDPFYLPSGL